MTRNELRKFLRKEMQEVMEDNKMSFVSHCHEKKNEFIENYLGQVHWSSGGKQLRFNVDDITYLVDFDADTNYQKHMDEIVVSMYPVNAVDDSGILSIEIIWFTHNDIEETFEYIKEVLCL